MRRIFIAALLLCAGCSSNKTQDQIKDYIKENINDPASYEPVSFGETQNDSLTAKTDPEFRTLLDSSGYWIERAQNAPTIERSNVYLDSAKNVSDRLDSFIKNYKASKGYKISHVFRKKNKAGGIILDSLNFRFDSSMALRDMAYKKQLNKD